MDHFKKPLQETCPNHTYLVKHKLKDCSMMKSFMTLGSLSQGMEVNKVPDEGDTMPFQGEDAVTTIYDGRPSPGRRHMPDPSLGTQACCGWGCRTRKCKGTNFLVH
jgi:hypothetical protein